MYLTTWILVSKDAQGELRLARCRKSGTGLPFSFDFRAARLMFRHSESRISCRRSDQILLMQGEIDISNIRQDHRFLDAVNGHLQQLRSFSGWYQLDSKAAAGQSITSYRRWVGHHLIRSRHDDRRPYRRAPAPFCIR